MTYEHRRRLGAVAGALGAALLTAVSTLALGGELPHRIGKPDGRKPAAAPRTVVEEVVVRRRVAGPAAEPAPAPAQAAPVRAGAPAPSSLTAATAPRAAAPKRRRSSSGDGRRERPTAKRPAAAPAPAPAPTGAATAETGGYRGFASATALAVSNGVTLARAGSAVALDGRAPETADALGPLVADLPAGRTAFARAIPFQSGGASADGPGDGVATASSPSAASAADDMAGMHGASDARTDPRGRCVLGRAISAADARAPASGKPGQADPVVVSDVAHSRTESLLDPANGARYALTTIAEVMPPDVTLGGVTVRFLGPVVLTVRAGGTAGSASVELGPLGNDTAAPLIEVKGAGQAMRYTAAEVLQGGGRHITLGAATLTLGGAPHARADAGAPPAVADDGTSAAGAADLLSLRLGDAQVTAGHVEAAASVPARGIGC